MARKFKRGDILISKTNKREFLFIVVEQLAGKYPYLCNRYTVQYGLSGQDDYTAEAVENNYRMASPLEKKIFLFIYESNGGLEEVSDPLERKLFASMCSTNGSVNFTLTDKTGAKRKFRLRSDSNDCGTRHILLKHFLGKVGNLSYTDVMRMLLVIQKGDITTKGNDLIFTYKPSIGRTKYQLICFVKSTKEGNELLIKSYYSDKKKA